MLTVGEILRQTREEQDLSIKTVVDHTYIQARFIIALECNDYTVFPADAYARGFLRNYAEMLGLNPSEMLDLLKRTRDTLVPIYDHEYYRSAIGMEPEIQRVEHIDSRKTVIEEAIATEQPIIDIVHTMDIKEQLEELAEQQIKLDEMLVVDEPDVVASDMSITNDESNDREECDAEIECAELEDEIIITSKPLEESVVIDTPAVEEEVVVTPMMPQTARKLDKDGYPQPPSFKEKLLENRNGGASSNKWLIITLIVIAAVIAAYFFLSGNNEADSQAPNTGRGLNVFKQTNSISKPVAQIIELSGKVSTRCWVSVVADGKKIFEDNLQANSSFKWQAKDSLKVTVGNVSALTELQLNGKPTNMGDVRSNVAERIFYLKDVQ